MITANDSPPLRLIVGMTGATGTIFGVRLLEALRALNVETHLVMSKWATRTLLHETAYTLQEVEALASVVHHAGDQGASISSGSFVTAGMIIAPCSMKSLAAVAHSFGENLLHRAADVVLKERRKLVLLVRETPLSEIHLENMLKLARMGASIMPPVPAFYNRPQSIDDIVNHLIVRTLDQFGWHAPEHARWDGLKGKS